MKSIGSVFALSFAMVGCSGLAIPTGSPAAPTSTGDVAANYKTLVDFDGGDGSDPTARLIVLKGALYGTTYTGGTYDDGTVFSISTAGKERVLHSFRNGVDGSEPFGGLVALGGRMYGTTFRGGATNAGIVFSIDTEGTERVIYN